MENTFSSMRGLFKFFLLIAVCCQFSSLASNGGIGCNLPVPTNNNANVVLANVAVNSHVSGDYTFVPSASVIDVLYVTNNGTGQVDFKIMAAVNFKKIVLVNNSSGTVKFRAGGNFPYPTITYCDLDDPSNSTVFESTVTQSSGSCSSNSDCYAAGTTLGALDVTATQSIVWYDAQTGGNVLSSSQIVQEGATYYAANSDGAGCESARVAVPICLTPTPATPFTCLTTSYLSQGNDFYTLDLASGSISLAAENVTSGELKGIGYNSTDGFV